MGRGREDYLKGRLSTVGLLIQIGCFVTKRNTNLVWNAETHLYKEVNRIDATPFSKDSLAKKTLQMMKTQYETRHVNYS